MKPELAKYVLGATCLLCFAGIIALYLLPAIELLSSTETLGLLLICGIVTFITGLLLTLFSRRGTDGRLLVLIGTFWMTTATVEPGPFSVGFVIAATAVAVLLLAPRRTRSAITFMEIRPRDALALGVVGLLSTTGFLAELLFPLDAPWASMFLTSAAMAFALAAIGLAVGCLGRCHLAVWAGCASYTIMAVMGATVTVLRLMGTTISVAALLIDVALAAGTLFLFVYTYRVATTVAHRLLR